MAVQVPKTGVSMWVVKLRDGLADWKLRLPSIMREDQTARS